MSNTNTGGPAFPVPDIDGSAVCEGMTLRDYIAAKAMQGIMAHPDDDWGDHHDIAATAYSMADAMLKAREA